MTEKDYIKVMEMLNDEAFQVRFCDEPDKEAYKMLCEAVKLVAKAGLSKGYRGSRFYYNAEENING